MTPTNRSLTLLLFTVGVASADGQAPAMSPRSPLDGSGIVRDSDLVRVAPPIVGRALPRTFQVVEVPVPTELASTRGIPYTIAPSSGTAFPGARAGRIDGARATDGGSVLLTLRVPTNTAAGRIEVARVRFSPPGAVAIEVPVEMIVDAAEELQLTVQETLRGVRPGESFTLTYRVTNLGNTPTQVTVRPILPSGWDLVSVGPTVRLGIHAAIEQQIVVGVPFGTGTGAVRVRLIASAAGVPQTSAEAIVEVVDRRDAPGAYGPTISTAMAYGWDGSGSTATGFAIGVDGYLTDALHIQARAGFAPMSPGSAGYALSQLGFNRAPPTVQLTAGHWQLGLGATGAEFSQLSGVGLNGQGMSGSVSRSGWRASVLLARPGYGALQESGLLAGGRIEMRSGAVTIATSATHLVDRQGFAPRQLDAVAVSGSVAHVGDGVVAGELAERWTAIGVHPGWSLSYDRYASNNSLTLRVVHAPGGGSAFAQATDQLFASGGHRIGQHVAVAGSYATSSDNSGTSFAAVRTTNWNVGPRIDFSRELGVSVSARQSAFSASGVGGAFNNSEIGADISATFRKGSMYVSSLASVVQASSETWTPSGGRLAQRGRRAMTNTAVGLSSARGVFELNTQFTASGPGSGQLPHQVDISLRADRVPVMLRPSARVYLNASVRQTFMPGFSMARTEESFGIAADLPMGVSIGVSAQRNPFLLSSTTAGEWAYGVRFGRGTVFPRFGKTDSRGVVFNDLNSNGVRDPGEPGMRGVVVRRGLETVVTGGDGEFRFAGVGPDSMVIDPLSLRTGLIVGPPHRASERHELAVVVVTPVTIALTRSGDDLVQADSAALRAIIVLARDEAGTMWVARRSSAVGAVFDALPMGQYALQLDLSEIKDRLELRQQSPTFTVGASVVPPLTVVLYSRPVAVKRFDGASKHLPELPL